MAHNEKPFYDEPESWGKRTLCCFVLDRSGSMEMNGKIDELNKQVNKFIQDIRDNPEYCENIEVAVVSFDDVIEVEQDAALTDEINREIHLTARGSTKMVDAVRKGIEIIEKRKNWYKQYGLDYARPFVVLVTDGEPDSDQDIAALATEIEAGTQGKHFAFISLGVDNANMQILRQITQSYVEDQKLQPAYLKDSKGFSAFFDFLENSFGAIVDMPRIDDGSDGLERVPLPDWLLLPKE